jgi:hypothetical protein
MSGSMTKLMIAAAAFGAATTADAQTANTAINLDIQDRATVGEPAAQESAPVRYNQVPPQMYGGPRPRDDGSAAYAQAPQTAYPYSRGVGQNNIGPGDIVASTVQDWQGRPGLFGTWQGRRPPIGNAANPTDPLWRYYDRGVNALGNVIGIGDSLAWQRFVGTGRTNALTDGRMRQSFNIHCSGKSPEQIQYEVNMMYQTGQTTNCALQYDNGGRIQAQRGFMFGQGLQRDIWYGTGLGRVIPQILPGPRAGW